MNVKKSTIYNLLTLVKESGSYKPRLNKNGRKLLLFFSAVHRQAIRVANKAINLQVVYPLEIAKSLKY
jgi:hypothetical protein